MFNCTETVRPALTGRDFLDVISSLSFGLIAIIGYVVMLIAMKRQSLFQHGGYVTLAHFSICDFINALVAIFYYPIGVLGKVHYPWVTPIIMFAEGSRKVFLSYMAISRFWVIVFPLSGRVYFDLAHTKKWLVIVWLVCMGVTLPTIYPSMSVVLNTGINQWARNKDGPAYFPIYSIICNSVPTVLMVVMYPACFYKLVKVRNSAAAGSENQNPINKREKQILYLFSANAVVFTLYWLPFYISILSGARYVPGLMEIMRGIQSAYNPFLYYILNPTVRNAVKALFKEDPKPVQGQGIGNAKNWAHRSDRDGGIQVGQQQATSLGVGGTQLGHGSSCRIGDTQTGQSSYCGVGDSQLGQGSSCGVGDTQPGQGSSCGVGDTQPKQGSSCGVGSIQPGQGSTCGVGDTQPGQGSSFGVGGTQPGQGSSCGVGSIQPGQSSYCGVGDTQLGQGSSCGVGDTQTGQGSTCGIT